MLQLQGYDKLTSLYSTLMGKCVGGMCSLSTCLQCTAKILGWFKVGSM